MSANNQTDDPNIPSSEDQLPPPEPAHPSSLTAKCHCGRINVEIPSLPTKINECRCSICYRYGAQWAYYHFEDVNVVVNGLLWLEEERTKGPDVPWKKVGVNSRMLAPHLLEGVEKKTGPLGELSGWDFKHARGSSC
ncbi:hypothetical protein INS49_009525 [Diaporthe citri]|uniref:uncharacterized protein n=1 Tax=Diaporthe citri TaxID=83186 RepID=UPI001C801281|nr:uncharacterized protein INS49_009525 [Diaporthe citri]KAG6361300.1 hypothetical protein INS49_009525 [Diaporthe citri]